MGPTWGRQDPGGPHVGPRNFAILVIAADPLLGPETSVRKESRANVILLNQVHVFQAVLTLKINENNSR